VDRRCIIHNAATRKRKFTALTAAPIIRPEGGEFITYAPVTGDLARPHSATRIIEIKALSASSFLFFIAIRCLSQGCDPSIIDMKKSYLPLVKRKREREKIKDLTNAASMPEN